MNRHGTFIWYELLTPDDTQALAFYGAVLGWTSRTMDAGGRAYHILSASGVDVGGMMRLTSDAAFAALRPGWLGYVGVDDVDRTVADVEAAGGRVCMPAMDLPGVGRLALLADPQGALFYVMRGAVDGESKAFCAEPGHCSWNELTTSEPGNALAFYIDRFGWTKGDAMPMPDGGEYRFIGHGDAMIGAVMQPSPDNPATAWRYYFNVADIDAAHEAVTASGGRALFGPSEVPGGSFIVIAMDPQGVVFGLVGPRTK